MDISTARQIAADRYGIPADIGLALAYALGYVSGLEGASYDVDVIALPMRDWYVTGWEDGDSMALDIRAAKNAAQRASDAKVAAA